MPQRGTMSGSLRALWLLVLVGSSARADDEGVPTYRTSVEKFLQGISNILPSGESSGGIGNAIGDLVGSIIPRPIKNVTARGFGDVLNLFEDHFHVIFPGTLWCGGGNIADDPDDVGFFNGTDNCCRDHDNCKWNIDAGKTYGRLWNNGIFTRSACACDQAFYKCLKEVNTVVAINIGTTYFNILRPQCFADDYPIVSCTERGGHRIFNRKCLHYDLDESKNKTLQWFDNPDFV